MKRKLFLSYPLVAVLAIGLLASSLLASQDEAATDEEVDVQNVVYRVRVTNITKGQPFSRIVLATHRPGIRFFALGEEAPRPLEALAEHGNPRPLAEAFRAMDGVKHVVVTEEPLGPGESVVVHLRAGGRHTRLSVAGMLVATNDGFFALNGARGPLHRLFRTRLSPGYDAGTEANDEQCGSIPGPMCGGNGGLDGEGFVHIHSGIHGIGDLQPARRDFNTPVARVQIDRVIVPVE